MTRAMQGLLAGAGQAPGAPAPAPIPAKLNTSNVGTLDSTGSLTLSLKPPDRHVWRDVVVAISVVAPASGGVANPKTPRARYYIGPQPTAAYLVDTTSIGNENSSAQGAKYPVSGSDLVWVAWSGGQPGYMATLSVLGTEWTQ